METSRAPWLPAALDDLDDRPTIAPLVMDIAPCLYRMTAAEIQIRDERAEFMESAVEIRETSVYGAQQLRTLLALEGAPWPWGGLRAAFAAPICGSRPGTRAAASPRSSLVALFSNHRSSSQPFTNRGRCRWWSRGSRGRRLHPRGPEPRGTTGSPRPLTAVAGGGLAQGAPARGGPAQGVAGSRFAAPSPLAKVDRAIVAALARLSGLVASLAAPGVVDAHPHRHR